MLTRSGRRNVSSHFKPYLFAETHFVRKGQPIFMLAVAEQQRRIPVNATSGLSQREKVEKARVLAMRHFAECDGEIKIWGAVAYYLFFYAPNRSVLIRPNGEVDEAVVGLTPPKAELEGFTYETTGHD